MRRNTAPLENVEHPEISRLRDGDQLGNTAQSSLPGEPAGPGLNPGGSVKPLSRDFWDLEGGYVSLYRWIGSFAGGRAVLEVGCGHGYGADYLSRIATRVIAVDIDQAALSHAFDTYSSSRIAFARADGQRLALRENVVDLVVSLEVLEHIHSPALFLREVRRVLKNDGLFVLSTPNKLSSARFYRNGRPRNPFHVAEYSPKDVLELLQSVFREVIPFRQSFLHFEDYARALDYMQRCWIPPQFRLLIPQRLRTGWLKRVGFPLPTLQGNWKEFELHPVKDLGEIDSSTLTQVFLCGKEEAPKTQLQGVGRVQVYPVPFCAICGNRGNIVYENLRDKNYGTSGLWGIMSCSSCNHLWLNPAPRPTETSKLYNSYYTHQADQGARRSRADSIREAMKRGLLFALGYESADQTSRERTLGQLLSKLPPVRELMEASVMNLRGDVKGRLLDVGCGSGLFLERLRSLGWEVMGVEPDPDAARVARERFRLSVLAGRIEDVDLGARAFDAVTLNHVIEHVYDPIRVLEICHRRLTAGGTLVLRTPNADSWGHRVFRESWAYLDPPRHLNLFSMGNLERIVRQSGFRVVELRTSTVNAGYVYSASRAHQLDRGPRGGEVRSGTIRRALFRWSEESVRHLSPSVGEEILLVAVRDDSDPNSRAQSFA